jgi:hypothetical protein
MVKDCDEAKMYSTVDCFAYFSGMLTGFTASIGSTVALALSTGMEPTTIGLAAVFFLASAVVMGIACLADKLSNNSYFKSFVGGVGGAGLLCFGTASCMGAFSP